MSLRRITEVGRSGIICVPLSPAPEESLLREASLRCTGANVHAVRGLVGAYTLAHCAGMRLEFDAAERRLRRFIATGVIEKS